MFVCACMHNGVCVCVSVRTPVCPEFYKVNVISSSHKMPSVENFGKKKPFEKAQTAAVGVEHHTATSFVESLLLYTYSTYLQQSTNALGKK